jgi:voltage-dependent calcium channel L type alpha-1D
MNNIFYNKRIIVFVKIKETVEIAEDTKTESSTSGSASKSTINPASKVDLGSNQKIKPIPKSRSLFLFSYENRFRRACHFISNHRWFSNSLLVCILVSSIMLAAEDPVNYKSDTNDVIYTVIAES